jgi:hypothetical protein
MAYLRTKNKCSGCRGSLDDKTKTRLECKIKNCEKLNADFCFSCNTFPCAKLKHLDKRYRTKYHMSMIENLANIENFGMTKFLEAENIKWTCRQCGGTICVHRGTCSACGKESM